MRRKGIQYLKETHSSKTKNENMDLSERAYHTLFSEGQSYAFKFWSIAYEYGDSEIVVDELPKTDEVEVFVDTFLDAGINEIIIIDPAVNRVQELVDVGCILGESVIVRRKINRLSLETEKRKGTRVYLQK